MRVTRGKKAWISGDMVRMWYVGCGSCGERQMCGGTKKIAEDELRRNGWRREGNPLARAWYCPKHVQLEVRH